MGNLRGRVILLNGTSSSGKSSFAEALRPHLAAQFNYYSSDQLAGAKFRPLKADVRFACRESFFKGFHHSIAAFAGSGNDLLIEHIVERQSWADELLAVLAPYETLWVGVHAPLAELERRERLRGDRQLGEALFHLKTHTFCRYDVEINTINPNDMNVALVVEAWQRRFGPFEATTS